MTDRPAPRHASRRTAALLLAVVLVALAPITGWLAWQTWEQVRQDRDRTQEELQRAAGDFAQSVQRELASSIDALTVLSQSEIFQHGRIAQMGRLLQGRPRRDWDSIFLLDPQGAVVLDTAPKPASAESLKAIHARAMSTLGPVVSGVGQAPGVAIAMPITQGGHVIYVLGVRVSDGTWSRLAANAITPEGAQARLYDAQRRLISQSPGTGFEDTRVYGACAEAAASGWHACVAEPAEPIDARRKAIVVDALKTQGVALLCGLVLALLLGRIAL